VDQTDLGIGSGGMDKIVGSSVANQNISQCLDKQIGVLDSWRHAAIQISSQKKDIRLVEGDPVTNPFEG
jgi:hypothetical protein